MAACHPTVEFKDVPGFPGYRVGSDGSVWTCLKQVGNGRNGTKREYVAGDWRPMRLTRLPTGRLQARLRGRVHRYVSRIVLEAFVGPCPPGMEACHGDGDVSNNRLTNLRWDTHRANEADKRVQGTDPVGERHGMAKLSADAVRAIRADRAAGATLAALAVRWGVCKQQISRIVRGDRWAHL